MNMSAIDAIQLRNEVGQCQPYFSFVVLVQSLIKSEETIFNGWINMRLDFYCRE